MKTGRLRIVDPCAVPGVVFGAVWRCGGSGSCGIRAEDSTVFCRGIPRDHVYYHLQDRSQGRSRVG